MGVDGGTMLTSGLDTTQAAASPKWEPPKRSDKERGEILARADQRWHYVVDTVDFDNRREALYDFKFTYLPGNQWQQDTKLNERKDRICLEINQLPQFVNSVVNDMRQNRAGIHLAPEDDASEDEAKRRQGIIRGIEYQCRADAVYDAGGRDAVVGGRGYWRVLTEYESDRSFNQRVAIKPIADMLSVALDPDYQEPDGSDRQWGIVVEKMQKDAFEKAFPDAEPLDWTDVSKLWTDAQDCVAVADYYERTAVKKRLLGLSDGNALYEDELKAMGGLPPGVEIVNERDVDVWSVQWFKLAGGQQILAEYEWRGTIVPIICCIGNEYVIEGKRYFTGLIRWARDPQRMYNFAQSTIAETAALTPKAPWLVAEGQDEGYEADFAQANRRNLATLTYKPTTIEGHVVPPPSRNAPTMVHPGLVEIANSARGDLRATIGIYDPSLGQRSNETSGRAILAREKQGDVATFNFPDNQARAIALTGRVIDELLPHVYDNMRTMKRIGPDGKASSEIVNGPGGMNALSKDSRFSIRVEVGPGYATRRQEARESMMAFIQAFPASAPILGDMVAKEQDWERADEVAERLEVLLPPPIQQQLAAKRQQGPGAPAPDPAMLAQMQEKDAQLQQMQQQMQAMGQELQQLQSGAAVKQQQIAADQQAAQAKAQADAQARIEEARASAAIAVQEAEIKARAEAEAKIKIAEIEAQTKLDIARIEAGIDLQIAAMKPPPQPKAPL